MLESCKEVKNVEDFNFNWGFLKTQISFFFKFNSVDSFKPQLLSAIRKCFNLWKDSPRLTKVSLWII